MGAGFSTARSAPRDEVACSTTRRRERREQAEARGAERFVPAPGAMPQPSPEDDAEAEPSRPTGATPGRVAAGLCRRGHGQRRAHGAGAIIGRVGRRRLAHRDERRLRRVAGGLPRACGLAWRTLAGNGLLGAALVRGGFTHRASDGGRLARRGGARRRALPVLHRVYRARRAARRRTCNGRTPEPNPGVGLSPRHLYRSAPILATAPRTHSARWPRARQTAKRQLLPDATTARVGRARRGANALDTVRTRAPGAPTRGCERVRTRVKMRRLACSINATVRPRSGIVKLWLHERERAPSDQARRRGAPRPSRTPVSRR